MGEQFRPEIGETERFSDTIEPITQVEAQHAELLPGQEWPLELQGKAETRPDGSFLLRYPKGDRFLSFVTLIHEVGHLAERERDPSLASLGGHDRLVAEETGAWQRGWARMERGAPQQLAALEDAYAAWRAQGKLRQNASMRELYGWVQEQVLASVAAQRMLFTENGTPQKNDAALAQELARISFPEFLQTYADQRVGETISEDEARAVASAIIAEIERES